MDVEKEPLSLKDIEKTINQNTTPISEEDLKISALAEKRTITKEIRKHIMSNFNVANFLFTKDEKVISQLELSIKGYLSRNPIEGKLLGENSINFYTKYMIEDITGLGPIEQYRTDNSIKEIKVNSKDSIYIYKTTGEKVLTDSKFDTEEDLIHLISKIADYNKKAFGHGKPRLQGSLPGNMRIHAVHNTLSTKGSRINIRKFPKRLSLIDLVNFGACTEEVARFLALIPKTRLTFAACGPTGSGKTTLGMALFDYAPKDLAIISIEDTRELEFVQHDWTPLLTREANSEGEGAVDIADLFADCMRMTGDCIVVGEIRKPKDAYEAMQAFHTGHKGSFITIHASSTHEFPQRLTNLLIDSGRDISTLTAREMIASAFSYIIFQEREKVNVVTGKEKQFIKGIAEISGFDYETGTIKIKDIFKWAHKGIDEKGNKIGALEATGEIPELLIKSAYEYGLNFNETIFRKTFLTKNNP